MATNARIFTVGVTTVSSPIHNATTFTPATWSALLASAPHAFGTIDLHLPSSSGADWELLAGADWQNITALGSLTFNMYFNPADDDAMLAMWLCVKKIIMSLNEALVITTVTIRNPFPASILRHRASRDVSAQIHQLKRALYGLDAHLSKRIDTRTLSTVILTAPINAAPISENEKPRVREFFPALVDFHDVL